MRMRLWKGALLGLALCIAGSGFAKPPRNAKDKKKVGDAGVISAAAHSAVAPSAKVEADPPPAADPVPQAARATTGESTVTPIAATTGTLGLFTLETGELLPKGGFSFAGYANKFTRMPGGVSVLNVGLNFAAGVTNWFNVYVDFEPYRHTHIGIPEELSLRTPSNDPFFFPQFDSTVYRSLGPGLRPAYVEDYPFAANNDGGVGEVVAGVKFGLLSERRGAPVSLSVRNDFIIPTRTSLTDLLDNGTQSGKFNDQISLALSKNWSNVITLAGNFGYRFTPDPTAHGDTALQQADQVRLGAGFILFPESRIQVMNEYTGTVFTGTATPNTTFGARDPVDGVWGVRLYPTRYIAVDLGYRYMLNLSGANDRNGFVIKVGTTYLPSAAPINHAPVVACSADRSSVVAGTNAIVNLTAMASDPDGDPLTYSWMVTGGTIEGSETQVRWATAGMGPGNYSATVRVDDGRGGTASCSVDLRVEQPPLRPPTVSLSADRNSVLVGERVNLTATGHDPQGFPLTYTWFTNGGHLMPTETTAVLDTTGVTPNSYTVTVRVDNGHGGAADASVTIAVNAPPPPPEASKINSCDFRRLNSARVDNVCKRILDDVALRMQNEPQATVVIVGYADPRERRPEQLAGNRATNTSQYLTSKGVDGSRIMTRTGTGQAGAGQANRRVDIVWVPAGAKY
jgi:Bacterial Ig domain/OmpA family